MTHKRLLHILIFKKTRGYPFNQNVGQRPGVAATISGDIAGVNQSVQEISAAGGQVNVNAEDLARLAQTLQQLVGRFKI